MRNTILALVTVTALAFAALTPAFADGLCADNHNFDRCPIDGVYGNPTPLGSAYRVPPRHVRHVHSYASRYPHHG